MTQTPFRDFLQEKHAEDYHGTDDGMPDSFDAWLSNLQVDDFLEYGDEFVFTLPKAEFTNDALLHMFAGLVSAGMNEDGEEEWIGNDKQWQLYNKISEEYGN